jgi:hypothetical protein
VAWKLDGQLLNGYVLNHHRPAGDIIEQVAFVLLAQVRTLDNIAHCDHRRFQSCGNFSAV